MSGPLDLNLPERVPEVSDQEVTTEESLPFALYSLVDFDDTGLESLRKACNVEYLKSGEFENPEDPDAVVVRLSPQPKFVGGPLRKVVDYHVQLGKQKMFDPTFFIVVIDKNWEEDGVLLITLADDEDGNVDSFLTKAEESGLILANLQDGETGWYEIKEDYELVGDSDIEK